VIINEAVGKVFVNARMGARRADVLFWVGTREDGGGGGCSDAGGVLVVSGSDFDANDFSLLDGSRLGAV
jgi:hypothetical protein